MCYSSESDNGARCTVVRTTSGVDVRHGSADIHQSPITIHDSRRDGSMATSESERMLGLIDDTCCVNGSAEGEQRMDRARRIVHNGSHDWLELPIQLRLSGLAWGKLEA